MSLVIRPAFLADIPAMLAIWNPIIRDTTITFTSVEKTPGALYTYISDRREAGRDVLMAMDGEQVLGFASYGPFRGGDGYAATAEHTVLLGRDARGRGAGRALLTAIEDHARAKDIRTMVAGISGENTDAIAFHAALGYMETARMPGVGRKFGRWLDLVLMQKALAE